MRSALACLAFFSIPATHLIGCNAEASVESQAPTGAKGDIASLSDEFDDPATLGKWQRADQVEGWNASQLQQFDIGGRQKGWMTMIPCTSTWYQDYRGVLAFKSISGDFVVTTHLSVTGRNSNGPPQSQFSLCGIMIRTPRAMTPATWQPGRENYVFLSIGSADQTGRYQFEVKTTLNSNSQLATQPAPSGDALIRVARIGPSLIMMKNIGGQWSIHGRYNRSDFPDTLQAGITCYTDWPNANRLNPREHNGTVIHSGNPDLVALIDYVRIARPNVPASHSGKRLDDPSQVSDAQLLEFLGK